MEGVCTKHYKNRRPDGSMIIQDAEEIHVSAVFRRHPMLSVFCIKTSYFIVFTSSVGFRDLPLPSAPIRRLWG